MRDFQAKCANTSALVGLSLLLSCASMLQAAGPTAIWLSQGMGGAQPFTYVGGKDLSMSSDGNFVVFTAASRDLTPDSDGAQQVYLRDMTTGTVQLLSKDASGQAGDLPSYAPCISPSGRYVTFFTLAHNLLSGGNGQIIWLDRQTGQMRLASVSTNGERANRGVRNESKVSSNGRYVVFRSWASNLVAGNDDSYTDVYLRDVVANTTVCVSSLNGSPGNRSSGDWGFDISNDARYVVFESGAGNLIPNDSTGGNEILLYDVLAKTLELVSLDDSGAKAGAYVYEPTVDSTGNRVAFRWKEGVYVRDRAAQRTFLVSPGTTAARFPDISPNGRFIAFGAEPSPAISGNVNTGRHVYVRDMSTATPTLVSVSNNGGLANRNCSGEVAVSSNGLKVAFHSRADNLDPNDHNGDWDVYLRSRSPAGTRRVSCLSGGSDATRDASSSGASMNADGRFVAFTSDAVNLVAGDTNDRGDVFFYNRATGQLSLVPVPKSVVDVETGRYWNTSMSNDGRYVAATWEIPNQDPNQLPQWVHTITDRQTGAVSQVVSNHDKAQLSANGRYLAYVDYSPSFNTQVLVYDRVTGTKTVESRASNGQLGNGDVNTLHRPSISADGRYVTFLSRASNLVANDTNDAEDVFIRDRLSSTTTRVSVGPAGEQTTFYPCYGPDATQDAKRIVFVRQNQAWVKDLSSGQLSVASQDNAIPPRASRSVTRTAISPGGRYILFDTFDSVFPGTQPGNNIWVKDSQTGTVARIPSGDAGGFIGNENGPFFGGISTDGKFVCYDTLNPAVVPGDTGATSDVFLIVR